MVWGSSLVVDGDGLFFGNCTVVSRADVYMASGGTIEWSGARTGTMWLLAGAALDLTSGQINEYLMAGPGTVVNVHGFSFSANGLRYTGYYGNWNAFEFLAADWTTTSAVQLHEVAIPGDVDVSGTIDLADAALFFESLSGPDSEISPGATVFDLDADEDVDLADWVFFQRIFNLP